MEKTRGWSSPSRYVQGFGISQEIYSYCNHLGTNALIILTPSCSYLKKSVAKSFNDNGGKVMIIEYRSNGNEQGIDDVLEDGTYDFIVGIGGGRIQDLAKAVANKKNIACVIMPSTISTDGPVISRSVFYNSDGTSYAVKYNKAPELILVDTQLIFNSPLRMTIAGIGDAITTKFEAQANWRNRRKNLINGDFITTELGMAISEKCYDILISESAKAIESAREKKINDSFDKIVEAVVLMSGLGSENCGCGIAHSIGEGLALVPNCKSLHGEQVAFGLICQLMAENDTKQRISQMLEFYSKIGLPICLEDLGTKNDERVLRIIAQMAVSRACWQETLDNPIRDVDSVIEIIRKADEIGMKYRRG